METDDQLRARIRYVAGESRELTYAQHEDLDAVARRHGLQRRKIDRETTQPITFKSAYAVALDPGDENVFLKHYVDQWAAYVEEEP